MKTLKSLLGISLMFIIVLTSCTKEDIELKETTDIPIDIEQITSMSELESLMKLENYQPTSEFEKSFLSTTHLRTCSNHSDESNSCSGISSFWPVSTTGTSNYLGGCMEAYLIDYFKLRVNGQYYYVCASGVTSNDEGRYLLRARVSNGKLVVSNLTFYGDKINTYLRLYGDNNCNTISGIGKNIISASL